MRMRLLCLLLLLSLAHAASAATLSYTGSLDPNNPNDVFITSFDLSFKSAVFIQTYGYGGTASTFDGENGAGQVIPGGGFDPYVSLFLGSGPSATFIASNDDGGCDPATADPVCEDSLLIVGGLDPGVYTLALTLPFNYSFAEDYGYGTLGDGFINLQGDYFDAASDMVRTSNYAVDITAEGIRPAAVTPEPNSLLLFCTGLFASAAVFKMRRGTQTI